MGKRIVLEDGNSITQSFLDEYGLSEDQVKNMEQLEQLIAMDPAERAKLKPQQISDGDSGFQQSLTASDPNDSFSLDSPTMMKSKKKEKHRTHRGLSVPMTDSKLRMDDPNLINFQSEINKIIYQCTNKALIVPYIKYTRATNEQDAASLDPRAQSQNKNYRRMSFVPRSSRTLSSRAWTYGTVDDTSREFGYLKACSNLHGLLQKYAKDFNMLIRYNEIFAFLSYPFTSRPLAEAACEESLKVFEYIVTTFEAHTTQFLVSQTNFLIKALQIPQSRIKDMLFENLKILLNRSAMGNNSKLLYKEPGHYLYLRAHYQSLGYISEEKNVASENISNALAQISEKIISITCAQYPNMKAADQFLISNFQILSKTLRINNYQVQKFAINELETLVNSIPTSQMTPSSSREFLSSCYITVVDYAYQKQFSQIESLKILMGLIYEKYPVDQISEVELKLALRSVLISLSICHGTPLATKPPKKQLDLDSIKYIKSVLANDKSHILIELMNQLIKEENITITIPTYSKIVFDKLDAKFVDALVSKTLPTLYNLFYENPLLKSTPALKTFLQKLKRTKPILFYTPIATLIPGQSTAIASKLMTILHYIGNIIGLNDLLFSEKDLVSLVILSDMKSKKGYSLAQIVFISEIILSFQRIPPVSDLEHATCDLSSAKAHHFMDTIETQIGSLLMYRTKLEGPSLCPLLRYLILNLILEARLHNTEPKRYNWIRVILSWIQGEDSEELLILDNTKTIKELKAVYQDYQFRLTPKLSQSELSELKLPKTIGQEVGGATNTKNAKSGVSYAGFNLLNGATASFKQHAPYFENVFSKSAIEMSLSLIAVLQPFFTQSESISLLPFLWRYLVINASAPIQVPLSVYAIMVSGDRSEELVTTFIQNNIESGTLESKVDSLQKFSNIFGKRSYIVNHLSSLCLTTKSFRKSNPVVKFVSTSVGIVEPVMQETWLKKLKAAGTSAEEIKMIQSLGWNDDEDEDTWRCDLNPTLVSTVLNELLDKEESSALSSISRKKPILTNLLCNLTSQLNSSLISCKDALYSIRHAILFNILRDEPAWFLRQYFSRVHLLEDSDLEKFATEINQVLLYSHDRPLFFSYLMFNYLLGWCKWAYRSGKNQDLKLINLILPITSRLLPSTHEVTYRELRKNKVDAILVSNGKFWPNDYTTLNLSREQFSNPVAVEELKFNSIPEHFFDLTMYRIGQYMIMEFMALKHPADAVAFSQTMVTFEPLNWAIKRSKIPAITKAPPSPVITSDINNPKVHTSLLPYLNKIPFKSLSSLHAIAWLTFISRVFDHMDPSNQPRQELETILSGITRILLNHLFNFHVVSKSIQLLARISLQYRRLFNLKSGYSMYLPAVFEAYCISDNPHIHYGIEFFVAFLFNLHQESFLFQMLGCLVPVCLNNTFSSYAKLDTNIALFEWLHCLDQLPTKDSLGILQGLPSYLIEENLDDVKHETVTWLPKALLPPKTQGWNLLTFQSFPMVKSFKMFITIMSYDPGSVRSEQFVTILGPLLNHMYKYPGLTELIDEGIKALINIFTKFSKNSSALGKLMKRVSSTGPADDASSGMGTEVNTHNHSSKAAWQQNDRATVKVRFIGLISCYIDVGGEITSKQISSLIYIMKSVFKSPNTSTSTNQGPITNFVKDILLKINDPEQKMIASCELLSVLNSINMSIYRVGPLSDLFSGLTLLIKSFGNSPSSFSDAIQFELLKLSRTGIQFFQNSDNLTVESLNAMSKSFSLFMVMLSELFPEEGINILSELPVGGISLAYIYIPICQYYSKDDKFFFYSQYLSSPEKYAVQKFWSSLLTVVSRPLIEISQYQLTKTSFPTQHSSNMNISVLYSLSHLAIRFILIRAEGLIFGNTLFLHEIITLLRLSIFRPLSMMNYSGLMTVSSDYNQDPIPDAIVNYSGWKLHQLFAKTNHPFLPHIENTVNLLIKVSEEGSENSHINPLGIEATQTLSIPKHILPPDSQYLQGRRPSIASVGGISDHFSIGPSHNTARRKSDASSAKNFIANIMSSHNSRRPSVKSQATNYDGISLHPQDANRDITQYSRQANSVIEYGTSTIIQCVIKEIHKCQEDLANLPSTEDQISFISNNTSMEHLPKSKRLSAIDILFPPNNLPEPSNLTNNKVSSLEDAMISLRYEVDQLINIFGHHNLQGHTINVDRFLMPINPQPVKSIGRTQPGNHPFVKLSGKT